MLIKRGQMQFVWDSEGNRYLDCIGGIVTGNIQYNNYNTQKAKKLVILFSLCRSLSPVKFIHFQFNVKVIKFYKFNFTCRKIAAALKTQIDQLWHTTTNYHSEPMFEYAEKLASKFPPHLNVCFFTNSGKNFKGTEFRKYILF